MPKNNLVFLSCFSIAFSVWLMGFLLILRLFFRLPVLPWLAWFPFWDGEMWWLCGCFLQASVSFQILIFLFLPCIFPLLPWEFIIIIFLLW